MEWDIENCYSCNEYIWRKYLHPGASNEDYVNFLKHSYSQAYVKRFGNPCPGYVKNNEYVGEK